MSQERESLVKLIELIANGRTVRNESLLEVLLMVPGDEAELDRMVPSLTRQAHSLTPIEQEVLLACTVVLAESYRSEAARQITGNPSSATRN